MKRIFKKIFGVIVTAVLLLTPIRSNAIDVDHIKIGVETVGKCYNTTFDTFNYIAFLCKHPEIGVCDKETAWAYYEIYCKPNGELAPCNLKAYMNYDQFDIDYFLSANGLIKDSGATDKEIFDYYCDLYPLYFWKSRGLTDHANALLKAWDYYWQYNLAPNGYSELEVILNYFALLPAISEYYTPDNPESNPYLWQLVTSIDGIMIYGTANCQGYANLFLFLMDMGGYPCRTVYSDTHMWNEVLYNGFWYGIDTCWADSAPNHRSARNDWFMFTY